MLRFKKEAALNDFFTLKMRDKILSVRDNDFNAYKEGIEYFEENC